MSRFISLITNYTDLFQEGRKPKTETFGSKNFNLSKLETSLAKAKEGFMALANVKWLGNLKPEKVEQVFNAVIEQLGKDDNVSYDSVKNSIDFALNRVLPSTNAGKWSRQFRNWIENLEDIQGTSTSEDNLPPPSNSDNTPSNESPDSSLDQTSPSVNSTTASDNETAVYELSDFQQKLYDRLIDKLENSPTSASLTTGNILSSIFLPTDKRELSDAEKQSYLNTELGTIEKKGLIKRIGRDTWQAIKPQTNSAEVLEPDESNPEWVADDELKRMTKGRLGGPSAIDRMSSNWDGSDRSNWGESFDSELDQMLESFTNQLKSQI